MKKIAPNDIHRATYSELKKTYKLTDSQLEQQIRGYIQGASKKEMKEIYHNIYTKK